MSYCQHFCWTFLDLQCINAASGILSKEPGHWISELRSLSLSTSDQGKDVSENPLRE